MRIFSCMEKILISVSGSRKQDIKNFYFAESSIIHFKGESTKKGSLNYVKMFYKAMSVFVKKHYGGTRAGTFYFLIKAAIFFRAGLAAIARFLKWIGLPVIDAGIILMSFWIIKFLWSSFYKTAGELFSEYAFSGFSGFYLFIFYRFLFCEVYMTMDLSNPD